MIHRLLFLTLAIPAVPTFAGELERPRFDPFNKPARLHKVSVTTASTENLFANKVKLTATLRAGNNSMVSIQGKIVLLGEKIDGYKLVEVNDRTAVFVHDNQRILLSLDNQ